MNEVYKMSNKDIILFSRKEDCCGCGSCMSICSQSAITMFSDEEGFAYPKIETEKCVGCAMCIKVCPIKAIENGKK